MSILDKIKNQGVDDKRYAKVAKSVEITEEMCREHNVPLNAIGLPTIFVHEYCLVNDVDLVSRRNIVKELVEIGIGKNTAQTQVTSYLRGNHPLKFSLNL